MNQYRHFLSNQDRFSDKISFRNIIWFYIFAILENKIYTVGSIGYGQLCIGNNDHKNLLTKVNEITNWLLY